MEKKNKTNSISAVLFLVTAFLILTCSSIFAQDMKNMPMHDMKNMKHEKIVNVDSTIIHKGVIDLKKIDKNKDGKVFQDQMDWNVISDKPGKCPLCGMTLKEVTLKSTKKYLIENGFKAK
jgi:formamidopyrimidine-DNA glycosylase